MKIKMENKQIKTVNEYIANSPKEVQSKLKAFRTLIKEIVPSATESISYGMPSYDKGQIVWFGFMKTYIGLYLRPPIIAEYKKELVAYKTTKSAIHFPLDKEIPISLIKKLIKARIKKNEKP